MDKKNTHQSLKSLIKKPVVLLGDIVLFYSALLLTLFIRYGPINTHSDIFHGHLIPFSVALIAWLLIFFIGGLYESRTLKNQLVLNRRFFILTAINGVFLILMLYFVPAFYIAPKTNFLIFMLLFVILGYSWRLSVNAILRHHFHAGKHRILLIGANQSNKELIHYFKTHPQLEYEVATWIKNLNSHTLQDPKKLIRLVQRYSVSIILVPSNLTDQHGGFSALYEPALEGVEIMNSINFYEQILKKIPLEEIDDVWVLKNIPRNQSYRRLRYVVEQILAILVFIFLLPLLILIALIVYLTSHGPSLYIQTRVGQHGKIYRLYKFRSMYHQKEKNPDSDSGSPRWTKKNDKRITPIGKILRPSHLDELPQLMNIIVGEMSFIGPRPERPKFIEELEKRIPYYHLRHILKPGVTGWAQVQYQYSSSTKETMEKLQHDLYYIKKRSFWLDIKILARTIKQFFVCDKNN